MPALKTLSMLVGSALLAASGCANALGLLEAYEAALKNDPAFRSAYYANESGKENRILGRSQLLPSVSGNYSGSRNNTTIEVGTQVQQRKYIARNATLQVRQSLFNLDGYARYRQGIAQSEYSESQFASQEQSMVLRVANAYFDVLYKQDQLALAKIERDMYIEQRKVNDTLLTKGEGTRTDALETQSRLDLAEAQLLEGEDAVATAKDTLAGIIGQDVGELNQLRPGFRLTRVADVPGFDAWKQTALENNPDLKALRSGIEIARQEINKARAGHAPRLDFVGTYQKSASDSINTINQDYTVRSLGFQLNIPIYAGGAVNAQTRQAAANEMKAKEDLDAQRDKVLVDLRKNYNQVLSSVPRINALIKAVESAQLLVQATEQSIKGGVRINLDLLNAQRQLFTAQRDLAQSRYNYFLATLNMRAASGTLAREDVQLIAAYFE